MPYMHMLSDPGMNYTLNRPLLDGTSAARITEINAVVPQIKDYESWHAVWLGRVKRAEAEKRWIDAASYYHGAEFNLPAGRGRRATLPGWQFGACARRNRPLACEILLGHVGDQLLKLNVQRM